MHLDPLGQSGSVRSGEQVGFASLDDLFHSLRKETGTLPGADRDR
jgi:hypothetical protein